MNYDKDKVDEMTLALLYLVTSNVGGQGRAWKGPNLETLLRLHKKGWISDPMGKSPSVDVSPEGMKKAAELFREHFAKE